MNTSFLGRTLSISQSGLNPLPNTRPVQKAEIPKKFSPSDVGNSSSVSTTNPVQVIQAMQARVQDVPIPRNLEEKIGSLTQHLKSREPADIRKELSGIGLNGIELERGVSVVLSILETIQEPTKSGSSKSSHLLDTHLSTARKTGALLIAIGTILALPPLSLLGRGLLAGSILLDNSPTDKTPLLIQTALSTLIELASGGVSTMLKTILAAVSSKQALNTRSLQDSVIAGASILSVANDFGLSGTSEATKYVIPSLLVLAPGTSTSTKILASTALFMNIGTSYASASEHPTESSTSQTSSVMEQLEPFMQQLQQCDKATISEPASCEIFRECARELSEFSFPENLNRFVRCATASTSGKPTVDQSALTTVSQTHMPAITQQKLPGRENNQTLCPTCPEPEPSLSTYLLGLGSFCAGVVSVYAKPLVQGLYKFITRSKPVMPDMPDNPGPGPNVSNDDTLPTDFQAEVSRRRLHYNIPFVPHQQEVNVDLRIAYDFHQPQWPFVQILNNPE